MIVKIIKQMITLKVIPKKILKKIHQTIIIKVKTKP
jgi:hypothetical protein